MTSLKNGTVILNANLIFSSRINVSYVVNQILNYSAVNSNILGQILPGSVSASGKKNNFFIIIFKFSIYKCYILILKLSVVQLAKMKAFFIQIV